MADQKVSALSAITNLSTDDLLLVVNDPAGTPTSNKVTVGNLFGNVAVAATHTGVTTFKANTIYTGTTATFSANVVVGGLNIKSGVEDRMQVANTTLLVNDRMQVANTTALVNDRMQVANVTSTYTSNTAFQSYIANTNPRLTINETKIANTESTVETATDALALKAPIANATFTGTTTANTFVVSTKSADPATSNAATETVTAGTIFYSNTYLYIATDANTIKRVALTTF